VNQRASHDIRPLCAAPIALRMVAIEFVVTQASPLGAFRVQASPYNWLVFGSVD